MGDLIKQLREAIEHDNERGADGRGSGRDSSKLLQQLELVELLPALDDLPVGEAQDGHPAHIDARAGRSDPCEDAPVRAPYSVPDGDPVALPDDVLGVQHQIGKCRPDQLIKVLGGRAPVERLGSEPVEDGVGGVEGEVPSPLRRIIEPGNGAGECGFVFLGGHDPTSWYQRPLGASDRVIGCPVRSK